MKILGIYRGEKYSPNMVSNDTAILNAVVEELKAMGHEVDTLSEDALAAISYDVNAYDKVFGMLRNTGTIKEMAKHNDNSKFINPLEGIISCTERVLQLEKFLDEGISIPPCTLVSSGQTTTNTSVEYPLWIKRGDGYAEVKDDVSYVTNKEEAIAVIENLTRRGRKSYAMMKHVEGDLIKFYGVEGTSFFSWDYASNGHSKFGLEAINGKEQGHPFNPEAILELATMASRAINVPVYGGDCVVDAHGDIFLIDFNDWPSFSKCRAEAAKAIAQRIVKH